MANSNNITVQLGTPVIVAGKKGDQGVGIDSLAISDGHLSITLSDGRIIDSGALPVAPGAPGEPGKDGENGENGLDGVGIDTMYVSADDMLVIRLTDGSEYSFDVIRGINGANGENGAPGLDGVSVTQVVIQDGHLRVALSDGSQIDAGYVMGPQGEQGNPGNGVVGTTINEFGQLVINLSDGSSVNAGVVRGNSGSDGISVVSVIINESGHLIVTLSDASTIDAGEIPSGGGTSESWKVGDMRVSSFFINSEDDSWVPMDGGYISASDYPEIALSPNLSKAPPGIVTQIAFNNSYTANDWEAKINSLMIETDTEFLFLGKDNQNVNSCTKDMQTFGNRTLEIFTNPSDVITSINDFLKGYATNGLIHVFISNSGEVAVSNDNLATFTRTTPHPGGLMGYIYYDSSTLKFFLFFADSVHSSVDGINWDVVIEDASSLFSPDTVSKIVKFNGKYYISLANSYHVADDLTESGIISAPMTGGVNYFYEKMFATENSLYFFYSNYGSGEDSTGNSNLYFYNSGMESCGILGETGYIFDTNGKFYSGYLLSGMINSYTGTTHSESQYSASQIHKKDDGLYLITHGDNNCQISEISVTISDEESVVLPDATMAGGYISGMNYFIKVK